MVRSIAAVQTPGRRLRSEAKRAAVLDAARALFLAVGYDRTTVDDVAASAGVSKRTVYDHFGDKRTIYLRVVDRVGEALSLAVRSAIDEEIVTGRPVREALGAFARRIATQTLSSSDYVAYRRLVAQRPPGTVPAAVVRDGPERMLETRFAELAVAGELSAPDPGVAARHFVALTIGLAREGMDEHGGAEPDPRDVVEVVDAGVEAFLRAYGPPGSAAP
ncbi:TetR/AcrR family transcriptional regulator [Phycicoccus sp. CSK15P-2]|uniref:TetR/AcrR family transcriptional regulator n=1 Tax=Phycicoccus sp. CSK15P-2 TaxID=2807627 RepID=UPI00194E1637|nr:TetR/AcrR family transcriptional regulator [Phycicoccus sp. CSK15P-2]MBM6403276.1 TetR/AcrR family transcriptional regulator [Phycicoccus sp. CSK15P-2]